VRVCLNDEWDFKLIISIDLFLIDIAFSARKKAKSNLNENVCKASKWRSQELYFFSYF
jgi:hypothetical protein